MTAPSTISEARQQLLERFRRGELQATSDALGPLIPRPPGAQAPLSPDLEQLWLHDRMAGGAPVNNESVTIHKRGPLNRTALERCFNEIVRRHEIWRSAFPETAGKVVQRIDSNIQVPLPFTDLSHLLVVDEREAEARRVATEDASRPFDLNVAPLFRAHLVRMAEDYHRIYLTVHRLAYDCASIDHVLMGELAALYSAYSAGLPSPLPELAFQYSDYAAWKLRQSTSGSHAAQMEYWRQNLAGDLPRLEFPVDRPRLAAKTWRAEMATCSMPAQLIEALNNLSTSEGVTLYMTLLAAFQVLLYRYCGEEEIVVGGKTSTRTRPEFEQLIGSFVNTVVFRSRIEAELSFREFLGSVKGTVLGALAHSEIPFDDVVRELAPKRDSKRHPLFQVLFSMRAPFPHLADGWDVTDMEVHSGASCFDLFVEFLEHPLGLSGRFVYSTDVFNPATIRRLQENFEVLLQELASNPDQAVSAVPKAANEKLDRKALPAQAIEPDKRREFVPPQGQLEERLTELWQAVLGVFPISATDNYFDLGGHSVLALQLFADIKFCFGLELPLATLFYAPTVRTMAGIIRDSGVQAAAPVVSIQPNGTKPAIYCIGPGNGELLLFRQLSLELGQDQPIYGLQPFSLVDRLTTVETVAAAYIEQLQESGEPRPFCLLGYSFGGLVAVEMARQLRKNGARPPLVALLDAHYPAGSKAREAWKDRIRRYRFHVNQVVHGARGLYHLVERLQARSSRVIHKVSTTIGIDVPKTGSDIFGRQFLASESYRAKPYPGSVILFKAESRPEFFGDDPALGWGKILPHLRIEALPGDHETITGVMSLKTVAQKLAGILEDLSRSQGPDRNHSMSAGAA